MTGKPLHKPADPRRLDLRSLARQGAEVDGRLPLAGLQRLAKSVEPAVEGAAEGVTGGEDVAWSARGELRPVKGAEAQVWLHLAAQAQVRLVCQRCLTPLTEPLAVARSFLFVPDEEEATRLDEEMNDDVLVLPRFFDVLELLEDELILALPIVPRHEVCPDGLPLRADDSAADEAENVAPHPFAALAALKKPPRPN